MTKKSYYPGNLVKSSGWMNGSYWEGIIQDTLRDKYKIKITAVKINMLPYHRLKGICTGNIEITPNSVGQYVWVYKWCFE